MAFLTLSVATLSGCAAVAPGYQPSGGKSSALLERAKSFEAGEVQESGVYKPSENERALDCRRLLGSMKVIISRLQDANNRPRPSAVAAAAQQASTSVTGKPGIDMTAEEKREKARLIAYNQLLKGKQCQPLDLEQELRGGAKAPSSPSSTNKK